MPTKTLLHHFTLLYFSLNHFMVTVMTQSKQDHLGKQNNQQIAENS